MTKYCIFILDLVNVAQEISKLFYFLQIQRYEDMNAQYFMTMIGTYKVDLLGKMIFSRKGLLLSWKEMYLFGILLLYDTPDKISRC